MSKPQAAPASRKATPVRLESGRRGIGPGKMAAKSGNLNSALINVNLSPKIELNSCPRSGVAGRVKKVSARRSSGISASDQRWLIHPSIPPMKKVWESLPNETALDPRKEREKLDHRLIYLL